MMFSYTRHAIVCSVVLVTLGGAAAHAQQYNEKTPGYKQAMNAFQAASALVIGRDISTKDEYVASLMGTTGYSGFGSTGLTGFFTTNELVQLFAEYDKAAPPGEKIADGINFSLASKFLKAKLKNESATSNKLLLMLLEKAFTEVYGRVSTPTEQATWTAKIRNESLWFSPVRLALIQQAQSDKKERAALIFRAYQVSLGRAATKDEESYWINKSEHYDPIVAANRSWLIRGAGAGTELTKVIERAIAQAKGNPALNVVSNETLKTLIGKFTEGKGKIYSEMVAYLKDPKNAK